MSFRTLLTHTVSIYRLTASSGIKQDYQSVVTGQKALLQPLSEQNAAIEGMVFGKGYQGFFPSGTNIQAGDKVIDANSVEYRVAGIKKFDYGSNNYVLVLMQREVG